MSGRAERGKDKHWCLTALSSHWRTLLSRSGKTHNLGDKSCRKGCAHGHEHNQVKINEKQKSKGKGGGHCAYSEIFYIDDCYAKEEDILHHSDLNIKKWILIWSACTHTHIFLPPVTLAGAQEESCGEGEPRESLSSTRTQMSGLVTPQHLLMRANKCS